MNRRQLLRRSLALAGTAALGAFGVRPRAVSGATDALTGSDPHPALGRRLSRIGFGSCAEAGKPQPVWDPIHAREPDLFVFLGDNIYADTRDMAVVKAKYAELAAKPGFQRLKASTPLCAIWDDHDFGEDDAGGDYPMKAQTREIFCDFWGEAANSPRRSRDGIYAAYLFGPPGRRVQVILPDLRWNRTAITKLDLGGVDYKAWAEARHKAGAPVPGPYARMPEPSATMLGEPQWTWLEAQLREPADLRILGSSLQVLADFAGWEGWVNYARDQQRLFDVIRRTRADRMIC